MHSQPVLSSSSTSTSPPRPVGLPRLRVRPSRLFRSLLRSCSPSADLATSRRTRTSRPCSSICFSSNRSASSLADVPGSYATYPVVYFFALSSACARPRGPASATPIDCALHHHLRRHALASRPGRTTARMRGVVNLRSVHGGVAGSRSPDLSLQSCHVDQARYTLHPRAEDFALGRQLGPRPACFAAVGRFLPNRLRPTSTDRPNGLLTGSPFTSLEPHPTWLAGSRRPSRILVPAPDRSRICSVRVTMRRDLLRGLQNVGGALDVHDGDLDLERPSVLSCEAVIKSDTRRPRLRPQL
ncbi:hypothetical protein OH77DRAFT_1018383 [Trametes cingulata]|nr:hypothetical protein OH77DRAFT_1018383 [Trametes cingulata]